MCNAHVLIAWVDRTCPVPHATVVMSGAVFCHMCCPLCTAYCNIQLWACHAVYVRHRVQTAASCCRKLSNSLTSSAGVARMLSMQGVQSVAVTSLPASVTRLPEQCNQLLQSLGQGKSLAEAVKPAGKDAVGGLVVYGLLSHKVATK